MKISIIVPAHNEEKYITNCLESIKANTLSAEKFEILVVCDGCNDDTEEIAKKYTKKVYNVYERNVSATRNFGAMKATGDVLVFVDADSIIAVDLLQKIQDVMGSATIGGTVRTMSLEKLWKSDLLWNITHAVRSLFYWTLPTASGLIFCRADAFAAVQGFDVQRYLAEDTHLLLALKGWGKTSKRGALLYLGDTWIKTSSRRLEREGYLWTIWRQFRAFFTNGNKGY
jgi:glycosyltransferase involved in cell wall biosynthesis